MKNIIVNFYKYQWTLIATLFLMLLSLIFPSLTTPLKAETMRNIAKKGTFGICVSPRAMPLSDLIAEQQTKLPGIQIEIGKAIAKNLKVELKINWLSYRYHAKYTKCDAFIGIGRIKGEATNKYLKKTIPFFKVELLLATRPGLVLKTIPDFKNKRVAVDNGSLAHDVLRRKSKANIFVGYSTDEKRLNALKNNKVDVALVNNIGLGWFQKNNPGFKFSTVSSKILSNTYEYDYAFGLRRSDQMTVRDFNDIINEMIDDGTFQKIFNKYGVKYVVNKFEGEFIR